jgi:tRNA(fMet)-specific endonuclease VapC
MRIALDTNAYSDFMRGAATRVQLFKSATQIFIPLFVMGELHAGFAAGTQANVNERNLERFLTNPIVSVLLPDVATTLKYAALFAQLRRQGTPIPTNDLWIAALALQHDLILCTKDEHFRHIPQLKTC